MERGEWLEQDAANAQSEKTIPSTWLQSSKSSVQKNIPGLDEKWLQAIADSDVIDEGKWETPKGKAARGGCSTPSAGIPLSKGLASYRELEVFAKTTCDDPIGPPVEVVPLNTTKKWFDRCAKNIKDGDAIKEKRMAVDNNREMLDPRKLPTRIGQIRTETLKADAAGTAKSNVEPPNSDKAVEIKADDLGQPPPHGPNEGIGSASSNAGQGAGIKTEDRKMPAATGKVPKPKGKAVSASKRRRTVSVGPTIGRQTPPAEERPVAPERLTITHGWTEKNKGLFEEWGQYYIKLVLKSDSLSEEDAVELQRQEKAQVDEHHTALERQKELTEEFKKTPIPRPEGPDRKERGIHRRNPILKPKDSK